VEIFRPDKIIRIINTLPGLLHHTITSEKLKTSFKLRTINGLVTKEGKHPITKKETLSVTENVSFIFAIINSKNHVILK